MLMAVLLCVSVGLGTAAHARTPTVTATVDPSEVYIGDTVVLRVRVTALQAPPKPDVSGLVDFDVQEAGRQTSGGAAMRIIINGRMQRQSSEWATVFGYYLQPRKAGALTIPPIGITHDGKTYASKPVRVVVREPEQQDDVAVTMSVDPQTVYVEQALTLTVDVYIRRLRDGDDLLRNDAFDLGDPPSLNLPWIGQPIAGLEPVRPYQKVLENLASRRGGGFRINGSPRRDLFGQLPYTFHLARTPTRRAGLDGKTYDYYRYRLALTYRALKAGAVVIPGTAVKGDVFYRVLRDASGDLRARSKRVLAISKPARVEVRDIPLAGRPPSFNGAVGRFRIEATAKPTRLRANQPITLSLKITGTGSLRSLTQPDLTTVPAVAGDFVLFEGGAKPESLPNGKIFRYSLRLKRASVQAIPPIAFSTFNPASETFQTAVTRPIPLAVEAVASVDVDEVQDFGQGEATTANRRLRRVAEGIEGNLTGTQLLADQQLPLSDPTGWVLLLILPGVVYVGCAVTMSRVRRLREDPALARSRRARTQARLRLADADKTHFHIERCDALVSVITGYVADRLNLPSGEMTPADLADHLRSAGVPDDLRVRVAQWLERCNVARFGGTLPDEQQLSTLRHQTVALLQELGRCRW